ncbi:MAG: WbqC family protein [Bacteroidia bacterium]
MLLKCNEVILEQHENFQKQSNRSRFHILSPNGIQSLQIPLVHQKLQNCIITDVKISYRNPWQRLHWRSIQTAYNRSPFFEFYKDEFETIFFKGEKLLFAYNLNLLKWILKILKHSSLISLTNDFEKEIPDTYDFRNLSNSKNTAIAFPDHFSTKKYNQVFAYKFDFVPNLSVIDLIFNCGKNAVDYL